MKPKEKAKQLVDTYWDELDIGFINSKKCSLIAVDEILSMKIVRKDDLTDEYWEEVKLEISKL